MLNKVEIILMFSRNTFMWGIRPTIWIDPEDAAVPTVLLEGIIFRLSFLASSSLIRSEYRLPESMSAFTSILREWIFVRI